MFIVNCLCMCMCFVSICKKTFAQPNRLGLCLSLDHLQMSCYVVLVTFSPRSLSRQQKKKTNSPSPASCQNLLYVCMPPSSNFFSRFFFTMDQGQKRRSNWGPTYCLLLCIKFFIFFFQLHSYHNFPYMCMCVREKDKMENNTSFSFCLFYAFFRPCNIPVLCIYHYYLCCLLFTSIQIS